MPPSFARINLFMYIFFFRVSIISGLTSSNCESHDEARFECGALVVVFDDRKHGLVRVLFFVRDVNLLLLS